MASPDTPYPRGIHFVGSVPLDNTEEVFSTLSSAVPGHLRTIPDGETAERHYFVVWQRAVFPPGMTRGPSDGDSSQPSITVEDVPRMLADLQTRYDDAAIASYQKFRKLRDGGVIPAGVKFQVCLPTPVNTISLVERRFRAAAEPPYEAALLRALRRIQDEIPHEDLAIQWDCAVDFAMVEGVYKFPGGEIFTPWFEPVEEGVLERIARCTGQGNVDTDVEMGFHLCYGDIAHKHFCEPKDTSLIVKVIKTIYANVGRKVDWVHLPVPKDRHDPEYLEPLKEIIPLVASHGTKLYIGLVHAGDEQGTRRRIETAQQVLGQEVEWGVGTECGMGRTPRGDLKSILDISAKTSHPIK